MMRPKKPSKLIQLVTATAVIAFISILIIKHGAYEQHMELYEQRIITGNIDDVWRIATDVNRWAEWDPHEEDGEIYGPFISGTKAYSKPRGGPAAHWSLTEVTEDQSWSLINKMLIGTLEVDNKYTKLDGNQVNCEKTMRVSGWILVTLFKLHFEKITREDMHSTWIALEGEIMSRADENHPV